MRGVRVAAVLELALDLADSQLQTTNPPEQPDMLGRID
jgi:hypothetical protein